MFSRKKAVENVDPKPKGAAKKGQTETEDETQIEQPGKQTRAATGQTKRPAFGDLTNAVAKQANVDGKKKVTKPTLKAPNVAPSKVKRVKKKAVSEENAEQPSLQLAPDISSSSSSEFISSSQESLPDDQPIEIEVVQTIDEESEQEEDVASEITSPQLLDLVQYDKDFYDDVVNCGRYAQEIFDYFKRRERMFPMEDYISRRGQQITVAMRSILVDWLVEIQENFELNHETLYLAVKLTDMYLSQVNIEKEKLQLVGSVAIFIAAKFDERFPPLIEDFTYVCDNAFDRKEFIDMEMELFYRIGYDLGIPISYRFLRRYAKVAKLDMMTLTLARYILETSLMDYFFVAKTDSQIAAAALFIAMRMNKTGSWEGDVEKTSGYSFEDIKEMVVALNKMLLKPKVAELSTIRTKYSHQVFHEVARMAILPTEKLLS